MNPKPEHEHLSAWLDGELPDAEIAELEAELARDPALRAELDALEQVVSFVRQEGPSQAPLGLHRDIMARIDEEFPERTSSWSWLRRPWGIPLEGWVLAAAAAAVLLLVLPDWKENAGAELEEKELSPAALEIPKPLTEQELITSKEGGSKDGTSEESLEKPPAPGSVKVIGRASTDEGKLRKPEKLPVEPMLTTEIPAPAPEGTAEEAKPAPSPTFEIPAAPEADVRYVIESADPKMKREVLGVAAKFGGARDLQNQKVASALMGSSVEELVVSVPQTRLNELYKELAKLGYDVEREDLDKLVPGGKIEVRLTLSLTETDKARKAAEPSPAAPSPSSPSPAAE